MSEISEIKEQQYLKKEFKEKELGGSDQIIAITVRFFPHPVIMYLIFIEISVSIFLGQ